MCVTVETLPITNPLTIFKNADYQFTVIFYDENEAAIDWTDIVFKGEIRASDNTTSDILATFTFDAGSTDGIVVGRLNKATVAAITQKRGYYDVKATQGGQEFPIISGDVFFEKGNTA